MKNFEACSVEELQLTGKKVIEVDGMEILLVYEDGEYYAVDNICPHALTRLISGRVENKTLTCSNHGMCFDLKTGELRSDKIDKELLEYIDLDNLPFGPLGIYHVSIKDNKIVLEV